MIRIMLMLVLLVTSLVTLNLYAMSTGETKGPGEIKVHRFATDESSIFSNAYIIELDNSLAVIDATLTVSASKALRKKVDSLKKPLAAVFVTHGHPDHYNGLGYLTEGKEVPVYSTQAVFDVIEASDAAKEEQWTPMFGEEWPKNRIFPDHIVKNNETIELEGVKFMVREMGPGESHSDSYWLVSGGGKKYAFVGDIVLYKVHAYLADGHFPEWLNNLATLKQELKKIDIIYPGHGEPGGVELLKWQEDYITAYVRHVKELLSGKEVLSQEDKEELTVLMKAFLPNTKLEFLIGLSADVVVSQIKEQ